MGGALCERQHPQALPEFDRLKACRRADFIGPSTDATRRRSA